MTAYKLHDLWQSNFVYFLFRDPISTVMPQPILRFTVPLNLVLSEYFTNMVLLVFLQYAHDVLSINVFKSVVHLCT